MEIMAQSFKDFRVKSDLSSELSLLVLEEMKIYDQHLVLVHQVIPTGEDTYTVILNII
jgi:hypothetical protein